MRTLIIFASGEGQTEKITCWMAERFIAEGSPVDRFDAERLADDEVSLDAYDAIIVAGSVHHSHYDRRLQQYLKRYQAVLNEMPSAFVSVSLGILSDNEDEREEIAALTSAFLAEAEWQPTMTLQVAGAIRYSQYGWMKRHLMQWMVKRAGGPTDASSDYEFTDWDRIDAFVDKFLVMVESCRRPDEPYSGPSIYAEPTRRYSTRFLNHV